VRVADLLTDSGLIMHAIVERITWRAEYDRAMLAASGAPPGETDPSAIPQAA
jgi:hypothetical protein